MFQLGDRASIAPSWLTAPVPAIEFPKRHLAVLQELASSVLDSRAIDCDSETLARDLLAGFYDFCLRWGLDRVLAELEQTFPPIDLTDRRLTLAEHPGGYAQRSLQSSAAASPSTGDRAMPSRSSSPTVSSPRFR